MLTAGVKLGRVSFPVVFKQLNRTCRVSKCCDEAIQARKGSEEGISAK